MYNTKLRKTFKHPIDTLYHHMGYISYVKVFLYEQHLTINYDIYNVHNRVLYNVNFRNYLSLRTNNTLFDI